MPTSRQPAPASAGLDRRTLLKVGAWAVPALAAAVVAPVASANTVDYDLTLLSPQAGSTVPMFTESLTQRYDADAPYGVVVGNDGSAAFSGTIAISLTVDSRMWDVTGFTYRSPDSGETKVAAFTAPSGPFPDEKRTYTATFAGTVPAGADPFSGIFVRVESTFLGEYPRDAQPTDAAAYTWALVRPSVDGNTANNVRQITASTPVSASPFGGEVTADFTTAVYTGYTNDQRSAALPQNVTLTSVGPNPIAAGDVINLRFDSIAAGSATPKSITLNGVPAPDLLVVDSNTLTSYNRSVAMRVTAPLAAGSVLAFSVSYTPKAGYSNASVASVSYSPATLNSPDERKSRAWVSSGS